MTENEHDGSWSEPIDLTPEKIGMLRFSRLTPPEREAMRQAFEKFAGRDTIPFAPALPAELQNSYNQLYPHSQIPTYPLINLLKLTGHEDLSTRVRLPASGDDLEALMAAVKPIADSVIRTEELGGKSRDDVHAALAEIYRATAGEVISPVPKPVTGQQLDLIIGLGARGMATAARANKCAELFQGCPQSNHVRLVLSGYHPYYAEKFEFTAEDRSPSDLEAFLPFGEAEAMAVTVLDRIPDLLSRSTIDFNGHSVPQLVIDPRARNTLESIVHSVPIVNELRRTLGRPIAVCFVTSPYHVRRTHAIASVQYGHLVNPESISSIMCASAPTLGVEALLDPMHDRHGYTVELYIRESVKLLGGRITGEF